jgi:hypothetical protein
MDLSGLTSVTTKTEMLAWLASNLITPVSPAISGSDLGIIMQKLLQIAEGTDAELVLFDTKSTNYTLGLTDSAIDMSVATANTITIPNNANTSFPVGTQILIAQSGTGQTTIVADLGVTINSAEGYLSLNAQYSGARLIKRDTDTWWLSGDLAQTITPVAKIVNINLTDGGNDASSTGWNNNLYFSAIGTSLSLLTSAGISADWSIIAAVGTSDTAIFEHLSDISFGNTDFPDDVLDTLWYLNHGTNFSFIISGLDPQKTYTVKTCAADNGSGDGPTNVTVGGSSQLGASPDNIAIELTFNDVASNSSGDLSIIADNTGGAEFPLLNAIIITEN